MKKDIEWLKAQICTEMMYLDHIRKERWSGVKYQTLRSVYQKINQLDEPEVLSQEWIDKHRKSYTMEDSVEISDLQNLLVPKQEELETKIQELIEAYKQEEDAYGELENGWIRGFIKDLKNLVEEEQKYYIIDKNDEVLWYRDNKGIPKLSGSTLRSVLKSNSKDRYQFTEQEIKDYDERFWSFAEPVEQVDFRLSF